MSEEKTDEGTTANVEPSRRVALDAEVVRVNLTPRWLEGGAKWMKDATDCIERLGEAAEERGIALAGFEFVKIDGALRFTAYVPLVVEAGGGPGVDTRAIAFEMAALRHHLDQLDLSSPRRAAVTQGRARQLADLRGAEENAAALAARVAELEAKVADYERSAAVEAPARDAIAPPAS